MSDSVRPHRQQLTRLPCPWDSPGKNTGVGCHFLLQCMKVESEREVAQSCPTLSDPMDCSLPGSSIYGIFQSRVLGVGCHCLLRHIMLVSYNMKKVKVLVTQLCSALCNPMECSPPSSSAHGILQARILEWAVMPSSRGSFQPRDQTQVFRTAGRFSYRQSHQGSPNIKRDNSLNVGSKVPAAYLPN